MFMIVAVAIPFILPQYVECDRIFRKCITKKMSEHPRENGESEREYSCKVERQKIEIHILLQLCVGKDVEENVTWRACSWLFKNS